MATSLNITLPAKLDLETTKGVSAINTSITGEQIGINTLNLAGLGNLLAVGTSSADTIQTGTLASAAQSLVNATSGKDSSYKITKNDLEIDHTTHADDPKPLVFKSIINTYDNTFDVTVPYSQSLSDEESNSTDEMPASMIYKMLMDSGADVQQQFFCPLMTISNINESGTYDFTKDLFSQFQTSNGENSLAFYSRFESVDIPLFKDETVSLSTGLFNTEIRKNKLSYSHKSKFTFRADKDLVYISKFQNMAGKIINRDVRTNLYVFTGNGYRDYFDGLWIFEGVQIISCDEVQFKVSGVTQVFSVGFTFVKLRWQPLSFDGTNMTGIFNSVISTEEL